MYVYKSVSLEVLTAETVTRNGNSLFRWFHPFIVLEIIQNNVWLHVNKREVYKIFFEKMDCMSLMSKK
jgi:hypothetical protein